ncbi:hypothetical protein C6497_03215 [Candidatus Poribacteria bacterium]|nr:MAG: hypothetical protein C6497_03215 [Candidatus Poribacteria bacterium]
MVFIGENMKVCFRVSTIVILGFLILVVGCGERTEDDLDEMTKLLRAVPSPGSEIFPDSSITITFDKDPQTVQVNIGVVETSGINTVISGPFPIGKLELKLTWTDGERSLKYTVVSTDTDAIEPEPLPDPEPEPIPPDGMVLIPEGDFEMGSDDVDADPDEQPVHTVFLDAFYIDENEITNAQFKEFILANPEWQKNKIDEKFANANYLFDWNGNNYPEEEGEHPVRYVSWYAAMAYAVWVDKRLPTESEWEKASRGGLKGRKYPWGNQINGTRANYGRNIGHTTPVGKYPPNDYGVYDTSGNVWEWCLDAFEANFYANSPRKNPVAGGDSIEDIVNNFENIQSNRGIRGSGWNGNAEWGRCANRFGNTPDFAGIGALGFRCVQDVE